MNRYARPSVHARGFSLLEVIAALVILSMGASAAFTWLSQTVQSIARLKEQEAQLLVRQEAIEYLRSLNPMQQPEGQVSMGEMGLKWTSKAVAPVMRAQAGSGGAGLYEVGLHEVTLVVNRQQSEEPWFTVVQTVPGYRQIAKAESQRSFGGGL